MTTYLRRIAQGAYTIALVVLAGSLVCSCGFKGRVTDTGKLTAVDAVDNRFGGEQVDDPAGGNRVVSGEGVTILLPEFLASNVRIEKFPARPLKDRSDKPEDIRPETVRIAIAGDPYKQTLPGELSVYSVEAYREAFKAAPYLVEAFDEDMQKLRTLLSDRPESASFEIPLHPVTNYDRDVQSRLRYVDFRGGKGVMFLAYYSEWTGQSGSGTWVCGFVGLTSDGRRYVTAEFVLKTRDGEYLRSTFAGDGLGESVGNPEDVRKARFRKVELELRDAPSSAFVPALDQLEAVFGSVEIE